MWRIQAAVVLVIVVLLGTGFAYFDWSQKKMATLNQNIAEKDITIAQQEEAMNSLSGRIESVQGAHNNYGRNVNAIRNDTDKLSQEITRPDIHQGASQNPRETEATINTFMKTLFDQFNAISRDQNTTGPAI